MHRVLFAFISICLIAAPLPTLAQDTGRAEQLALAERAIRAAQTEQLAAISGQMSLAMRTQDLAGLSPQDQAAFMVIVDEVMATMMTRMVEGLAVIYADLFTAEELLAYAEFYESSIGQSILSKSMAAAPQYLELVRSLMPDLMRQMVNRICDQMNCAPQQRQMLLRDALAQYGLSES